MLLLVIVSPELVHKYARGDVKINTKKVKHKALRKTLMETQDSIVDSAVKNASTEILLPAEVGFIDPVEKKVFKIKQKELREHIDVNTAR